MVGAKNAIPLFPWAQLFKARSGYYLKDLKDPKDVSTL
jgi:hypothetical protein